MKINIITTIEVDRNPNSKFTKYELTKLYDDFRSIIKDAHESKDVTNFMFVNADTNEEIENEAEE